MSEAVLEVTDLVKLFQVRRVARHPRREAIGASGVGRVVHGERRRDARTGGGVRFGQDHGRSMRAASARADRRVDQVQGHRAHQPRQGRHAGDPQGDADRLPGPVRVARPEAHGRRGDRRAVRGPERQGRPRGQGRRPARARRARPRPCPPLPARVLGWPAPTHRHRQGARPEPVADRARRAGLGARRVDPGGCRQPARGPAGRARTVVRLHRPRPVGRAATSPTSWPSCTWASWSRSRRPTTSTTARPTRTRRRCCRPSPSPTRASSATVSASCSRARCRRRSTRRRAAGSAPAARRRRTSARPRSRCSRTAASAIWSRATSPR